MGRLFNMDNPIFVALGRLADLMILNLIFIVTCIPVVTIGASCTAMSYVTLKFVKHEENYIVKSYFKSFKENFKQATIIWLICLAIIIVVGSDFLILSSMGGLGGWMKIALAAVSIFMFMTYVYIFPVLSRFVNTIVGTIKNSFIMAVVHFFPTTILLVVIDVACVAVTFLNTYTIVWGTLFWIMFGFSTVSYLNSKFLVKVFEKYMVVEEEPEEPAATPGETQIYEMSAFKNLQPQPFVEEEVPETTDKE